MAELYLTLDMENLCVLFQCSGWRGKRGWFIAPGIAYWKLWLGRKHSLSLMHGCIYICCMYVCTSMLSLCKWAGLERRVINYGIQKTIVSPVCMNFTRYTIAFYITHPFYLFLPSDTRTVPNQNLILYVPHLTHCTDTYGTYDVRYVYILRNIHTTY